MKAYTPENLVAVSRYQRYFPTLPADIRQEVLERIAELIDEEKKNPFPGSMPISNENYIETVLTFASGDHFRIACESIEIGDNYIKMPKEPDENDFRLALLKAINNA